MGKPLVLDSRSARRLGSSYELLVPFLEQGSTAVVVPIATPAELLATLTVVSLDPARRIGQEAVETALFVAGQAALAIDNARLYQQQKDFADTMQRSLLPRGLPEIDGLDVGAVYESSARVEVGGDVYDFLTLPDGKLAVVLGDASGHGIAAIGRHGAREVRLPLARPAVSGSGRAPHAGERSRDRRAGRRRVRDDGLRDGRPCHRRRLRRERGPSARRASFPPTERSPPSPREGLRSASRADQHYEQDCASLAPGAALCLYTDGLIEVRRDGVQYGVERLDAALAAGRELSAQDLAEHVVADARRVAGEPGDDYALVVIRRT